MKMNKIVGSSIGVAAALALSASSVQAQNLVDPGFENPFQTTANPITVAGVNQGWALFNGAGSAGQSDMSASIDSPHSGTEALLETANVGNNWNPAGAYQVITGITPGDTYTFSVWALTDTANDAYASTAGLLVQLGFETAALGGADSVQNPGNTVGISGALPAENTWAQYSVTATAPAGETDAIVYLMFQDNNGATVTEDAFYDDATLVQAVPEPTTLAIAGMGLASSFFLIRRRKS
jgi:hypothetical protein